MIKGIGYWDTEGIYGHVITENGDVFYTVDGGDSWAIAFKYPESVELSVYNIDEDNLIYSDDMDIDWWNTKPYRFMFSCVGGPDD